MWTAGWCAIDGKRVAPACVFIDNPDTKRFVFDDHTSFVNTDKSYKKSGS